ncbi:Hsp70 family protein [Pseudarthrobacter niigatensis]|uniref:Actin-like ATPase involved in cell morphogenesis n=1 Tax=Pseudarthrobacter niigatensis TaxID=369935 RepID=A0AAJ1SUZ4_9MICC|nr:Hsp70 family protein [Pseudarthrobacter niigatensis]MDQ0146149.1 actin-like ATPase involved in cell morphogenesis [Pseudarthrobacter niigatensis]MDQ0266123.1 actin-like ATPase involved in cell morphogenesis [Pseudarthrobacter niigatensis]
MSYALAVDVGTSFTAAAVVRFHQGPSAVPECLPLGARGASIPSVVYFPEEGTVLVGEAAERRGLDSPERVAREFKRRIGDDVPIILGTLSLQPEDVFATVARWVADRAAEREGGPASAVYLTHPAAWGSHRLSVIREALTAHGVQNVTLLPEPEAAALHYASQVRVEEGSTIAVYDLGGGTFDTAVLRKAGTSRFELLGRPEGIEDLGGADFDAAVFSYVAAHTGNALADLDATDPAVLGALARLRRECVEAKEALSADSEASIPVLLPGVQQQVRLVRSEFEALIEEPVRETVDALEHSLAQLHLAPADLSTVLLIGGSSRIPLVAQVVSEELDRPIAVDADPKSSICLGAAVAALLAHTAAALETAAPAGTEAKEALAARTDARSEGAPAGVVPPAVPPAPTGPAMPSWSRKYATAGAGPGHGASGREWHGGRGAHAPKPTVRITAVAAAAALLTVLTATAAQSPDGFGSLTAMFVPQAGASTEGGSTGQATPGAGATPTVDAPQPLAGIEASVRKPIGQVPGLDVSASPTTRQASGGEAAVGGANPGGAAAAGGNPPPGADAGATGTGIIPDSATVGPAMPPGTAEAAPTGPAPVDTASPDPATPTPTDTTQPTTTDPGTPSPSGTGDPSGSGTPTPDPGTSSPGTGEPTPTVVPTTLAAPDPTGDPVVSPTADLTPTPAVAPSPTPEDATASPIETAVATASTTSPGA